MNVASRTSNFRLARAAKTVAAALGHPEARYFAGGVYFDLSDGWRLALHRDVAGRIRVEACYGCRPAATMWADADDRDRLAGLALDLRAEIDQFV